MSHLPLQDGEYIVENWKTVVLTNRRLLVPSVKEGKWYLKQDIPLESIIEVVAVPHHSLSALFRTFTASPQFPEVDLNIFTKETTESFVFKNIWVTGTPDPQQASAYIKEKILQQIRERRQELERKRIPLLIDFSFLKSYIEKGGIILTTLKCPHCSAPIKLPKNGTETVCDHCRSTIYAQDIFEKVKTLIG